jgi:FKBP-type peptidyl-prolyl cis-trans isomerase (trigger factor)
MDYLNKYKKELTPLKKATLESLKSFFGKEIELRISNKIRNEIAEIFKEQLEEGKEKEVNLLVIKAELERQINLAKTELRSAKKLYKKGEMNRDELFDYEFRLVELRMQLDDILNKLNGG